jgi:hypothetical protein
VCTITKYDEAVELDEITEKICRVCNEIKNVNEFYRKRTADGYRNECKKCINDKYPF